MEKVLAKFKDPQRTDTQNTIILWLLFLLCFAFGQLFSCLNSISCFVMVENGISIATAELVTLIMQWLVNALALVPVIYYAIHIPIPKKKQ